MPDRHIVVRAPQYMDKNVNEAEVWKVETSTKLDIVSFSSYKTFQNFQGNFYLLRLAVYPKRKHNLV